MDEIKVTDHHTAESFEHYTIRKNDIYIADAGYGRAKQYNYIVSRKGEAILRITPNHVKLINENGEKINMTERLDSGKKVIDFTCHIQYVKKLIPVRIIASQLPEDKKLEAIKRKKKTSYKNQNKIKPETIEYAKWVIIATSLSKEEYTAEQVLVIYRSRWQIELLFKRIKQHFKVTKIRPSSEKYAKALILLWLIIWALAERQAIAAEQYLIEKKLDMNRFSTWNLSYLFFHRIKSIIESAWATLVDVSDDILLIAKCLQNHKGSRVNQYYQYHFDNFSAVFA